MIDLRFVIRDGKRILQWRKPRKVIIKQIESVMDVELCDWEDVPTDPWAPHAPHEWTQTLRDDAE